MGKGASIAKCKKLPEGMGRYGEDMGVMKKTWKMWLFLNDQTKKCRNVHFSQRMSDIKSHGLPSFFTYHDDSLIVFWDKHG